MENSKDTNHHGPSCINSKEQQDEINTPIVNKNLVFAGQGYDMYGNSRDGKYYCKLEIAKQLEIELIKANKIIKKLERKLKKYECD